MEIIIGDPDGIRAVMEGSISHYETHMSEGATVIRMLNKNGRGLCLSIV